MKRLLIRLRVYDECIRPCCGTLYRLPTAKCSLPVSSASGSKLKINLNAVELLAAKGTAATPRKRQGVHFPCVAPFIAFSTLLLGVAPQLGRRASAHHVTVYAPYRLLRYSHSVRFDIARRTVYGNQIVLVRPKRHGLVRLLFNSLGIRYAWVNDGAMVTFTLNEAMQQIEVYLPRPIAHNDALTIEFSYHTRSQHGLYFILPDAGYPTITPEIWTQGEPTDNRRWTRDEPNEKTPSELIVTVPHRWAVVANGYLKAHRSSPTEETWDWRSSQKKSTYLIAFAAGPLVKHQLAYQLHHASHVGAREWALMQLSGYADGPPSDYLRLTRYTTRGYRRLILRRAGRRRCGGGTVSRQHCRHSSTQGQ